MISNVENLDCMEGMKKFPDKFFDLAVVDPPYFSGPEKREYYGGACSSKGVKRVSYPVSDWSTKIPDMEYYRELMRVSKQQIIWGINYFEFSGLVGPGRIVWDKCNDASSYSDAEIAAISCIDSTRLFRYMWNGMMQGKSIKEGNVAQGNKKKNEKRIHPTQKPVLLYGWTLNEFAPSGSKVLDTHVGSGSSRIAAYRLGLDFWGFEIDGVCCTDQEKRFEIELLNGKLF